MRISDWSSDVCSSDLARRRNANARSFGKAGHDEGRIFSRLALPLDPHSRMYRAPGSRVEQLVIAVRGPRHGDSRDILYVREVPPFDISRPFDWKSTRLTTSH